MVGVMCEEVRSVRFSVVNGSDVVVGCDVVRDDDVGVII